MPRLDTGKSDFVLGMSLAEVMLLLVFSVLATTAKPTVPANLCEDQLAECREGLKARDKRIAALESRVEELEDRYAMLKEMIGFTCPTAQCVGDAIATLKRGYAECSRGNNALIEVSVVEGAESVELLHLPDDLATRLRARDLVVEAGSSLTASAEIHLLLTAVREHGTSGSTQCRFDYRARYTTPSDYQHIRQRYERYLYPGELRKVTP